MSDQQPDLREIIIKEVRNVATIGDVTAGSIADTILQSIERAGYRWDQVPNRVHVAVTHPLGTPPSAYRYDAHVSVHRTEDGAQRALTNWLGDRPEYRGLVTLDAHPVEIAE